MSRRELRIDEQNFIYSRIDKQDKNNSEIINEIDIIIQKIFKDENGTQYLNRVEYPSIPIRDDDVFIRGVFGETFMNIAHRFYNNKDFWWIIARANNQNRVQFIPNQEKNIVFHKM